MREIQQDGQKLQVYVELGEEALVSMLHLLEKQDTPVQAIALAHPSLDDALLRQTGRSLREETWQPTPCALPVSDTNQLSVGQHVA